MQRGERLPGPQKREKITNTVRVPCLRRRAIIQTKGKTEMSDLEKMSKYARKKALRKQQEAEEAKAEPEKKPKGEPTPPRGLINDLGDKPKLMSQLLSEAAARLKEAYEISAEVLLLSAKGIQQAEPRAINQFLLVAQGRVANMAIRSSLIPNVKQW